MNSMAFCEECETFPCFYHCDTCQQDLCISCDLKIHDKGKRKFHNRVQLKLSLSNSEKNFDLFSLNAMVFCVFIGNLESKQGLLAGIRKKLEDFSIETLFLLVWNENNEKINKIMLEIQLNLTKQKVIVLFMKSGQDLEAFFRGFKKEEEKYKKIRVLVPNKLIEEVKRSSFKSNIITNTGKWDFLMYEDELFKENASVLERTIMKKSQKASDFEETPSKTKSFETNTFNNFNELQPYKLPGLNFPPKIAIYIQDFFRFYAKSGLLMLDKNQYLPILTSNLIIAGLCSQSELSYILHEAEKAKLFHTTIRRFGSETETFPYISLHFECLSLESLFWVLKSLHIDEMTPTEKVILSRIKESFCLKLPIEVWKSHMDFLLNNPEKAIGIRLEKDSENPENYCLFLAWEKWVCNDKGRLYMEFDQSNWDEFLDFLRSFFFNPISAKISFKSVENLLEKQEGKKKYAYFNKKFLKTFIPGGKYGCCQFIKCCGTPNLRTFSFGKLSLFVQEALDRGVLEYYKTLLIATEKLKYKKILLIENKEFYEAFNEKNAGHAQARDKIKEVLLRVLDSFPQGVNLSRLPKILQFYLNVPFDCQEFGFKKLKDFLTTFEEIELIEFGDNIVARLKGKGVKEGKGGGGGRYEKLEEPYHIYKSSEFK